MIICMLVPQIYSEKCLNWPTNLKCLYTIAQNKVKFIVIGKIRILQPARLVKKSL